VIVLRRVSHMLDVLSEWSGRLTAWLTLVLTLVTAWDVLEHVKDPYDLLTEIHSHLRPGGILCLSTLDMDNWFPRLLGRHWPWIMDMHLYYFTRPLLIRWFDRAGYSLVHVEKYRHYAMVRYIWKKAIAILPEPLARLLRPLEWILPPRLVVPVSFGDIKLFIVRKHHGTQEAETAIDAFDTEDIYA